MTAIDGSRSIPRWVCVSRAKTARAGALVHATGVRTGVLPAGAVAPAREVADEQVPRLSLAGGGRAPSEVSFDRNASFSRLRAVEGPRRDTVIIILPSAICAGSARIATQHTGDVLHLAARAAAAGSRAFASVAAVPIAARETGVARHDAICARAVDGVAR